MQDAPDQEPPEELPPPTMHFSRAILFEASLVLVAAVLAWVFDVSLLSDFAWEWKAVWLGITSTLPMLAFFGWMLQSSYPPFVEIQAFLQNFVQQLFGHWSVLQLAALSIVAGIGEEILFRGVIQLGSAKLMTPVLGVIVASFAFAICHALTKAYFISTFVIGIYLSLVWQAADNLLAPIITHAVYDFAALLYFMKWHAKTATPVHDEAAEDS